MSLLALSPEADRDIREAVRYLRDHAGAEKARDFAAALQATGRLLASHPEMGRPYHRTQTGIKLRAFPVTKFSEWLLFYEVVEGGEQRAVFVHRAVARLTRYRSAARLKRCTPFRKKASQPRM